MRFRKSFKLAPGIRMNLSGSGLSLTAGPRGASVNFGSRGTFLNAGIPGTGLSTRTQLTSGSKRSNGSKRTTSAVSRSQTLSVKIHEDGLIGFLTEDGEPASESAIKAAKRQHGERIKEGIQNACDKINSQVESLGTLHTYTPAPNIKPTFSPSAFTIAQPAEPKPKKISFIAKFFKSVKNKIEATNREAHAVYLIELGKWQDMKVEFEKSQLITKQLIEDGIYSSTEAMSSYFESRLQEIEWPKETNVSFDIFDSGRTVFIDVDLPEIEDMPNKIAAVPSRGFKLNVKNMSQSQIQKLYMNHVHAIGFRVIGEAFSSLPLAQEVLLSTFTQRPDPATGNIRDDYLYSVKVDRSDWSKINFGNLSSIEIVEVFSKFDLIRSMTKTGIFKPITPHEPQ